MASIYELKNEFDQLWMILEEELVDDDALNGPARHDLRLFRQEHDRHPVQQGV